MKLAFITGITGQDGSYLSELLLSKNYKVYGIVRRNSTIYNTERLEKIKNKIELNYGDVTDGSNINKLINNIINNNINFEILEIYNLAAQSHVKISFEVPEYTAEVDAIATLKILEIINSFTLEIKEKIKFYQAGTSEMFGKVLEVPQNELTGFNPQSPYGSAKVFSYFITKNYRESYNLFAINGILFNHESSRRGENFVTKKIINGIKKICLERNNLLNIENNYSKIKLGNLYSKRDWGHAKDYVNAMWLMMQNNLPKDYVVSMNKTYSIKEFVEKAFKFKGIDIIWEGKGIEEKGRDSSSNKILVEIDSRYFRPLEVDLLIGDSRKIRDELNWKPEFDTLDKLIEEMFN